MKSLICIPVLLVALAACGGSSGSSEDLVAAYKECQDMESGPINDSKYTSDDGNSGITDDGNTLFFEGSGGECVLNRLDFPESITRTIEVGSSNNVEESDGFKLTWSWESYDTGMDMIITTND